MTIKTTRLTLTPVTQDHVQEVFAHFTKEIVRYMNPSVSEDISETQKIIEIFIEQRSKETDLVYAILLKENKEFIGLIGLHGLKSSVPDIGIWTKLSAHGHHYGREAVGRIIEHAKNPDLLWWTPSQS